MTDNDNQSTGTTTAPTTATTSVPPGMMVHFGLVFVQAAYATLHVAGKTVMNEMSPFAFSALRASLAAPLLLVIAYVAERYRPSKRELMHLALLGFFGVFANQLLFLNGLSRTTATNAAILQPAIPVFTAALAAVFGLERVTARRAGGIALAIIGALVMLNVTNFSLADDKLAGNLLIVCNCMSYSIYLILQRPILKTVPPITTTAYAFLFGGMGIVAVSLRPLTALADTPPSPTAWFGIAWVIAVPTIVGYSVNMWAMKRSSATLVATYITLQPLCTALLAGAMLGESVGWREAAGFGFIIAGLALVSRTADKRVVQVELE
ncbi:MAG: DMT family transporter [Deltaproteobacteria bacterium]|nr:DMT family transporter [Deltaproteobacteria bacterium]MCB9478415.1 DMT family transporter [Deltaproteobacteria bacterium]